MKSAERNVGYLKGKVARKPWITTAIMEKMQERKNWKNMNTEEGKIIYWRLNNELRRETDQARERWWENECNELKNWIEDFDQILLHTHISKLFKPFISSFFLMVHVSHPHRTTGHTSVLTNLFQRSTLILLVSSSFLLLNASFAIPTPVLTSP